MSLRKKVTITRHGAGSYVLGVWTEGSISEIDIFASVQPLRPMEMQALPEGRRSGSAVKIYTDTQLIAPQEGINSDTLEWCGKTFEVISCDMYQNAIISHYKALAVEVVSN